MATTLELLEQAYKQYVLLDECGYEQTHEKACYCTSTGAGLEDGSGDNLMCLPCKMKAEIEGEKSADASLDLSPHDHEWLKSIGFHEYIDRRYLFISSGFVRADNYCIELYWLGTDNCFEINDSEEERVTIFDVKTRRQLLALCEGLGIPMKGRGDV